MNQENNFKLSDNSLDQKLEFSDFPILERMIKKLQTESVDLKKIEGERSEISIVEKGIDKILQQELALQQYLKRRGINIELQRISNNLWQIDLEDSESQLLDELPTGYVYHGGAARALLARKLGINPYALHRDIDLAYAGDQENRLLDEDLAKKYSPDDYEKGHGVNTVDDEYFDTRDFTINELLIVANKIILTKACLLDTVRGIVRFTKFEKKESYDNDHPYYIKPKLLAKALRFVAEDELLLADANIYKFQNIDSFHIALHLDRALGSGEDVANKYIQQLKSKGQIPSDISTISELLEYLYKETDFVFRFAKKEQIDDDFEFVSQKYEHLPLHQGMSRRG